MSRTAAAAGASAASVSVEAVAATLRGLRDEIRRAAGDADRETAMPPT